MQDFVATLPYDFGNAVHGWVEVCGNKITIKKGYCWDGATGAVDTKAFMRGSLVHDALYQLIRLGLIDIIFRKLADEVLYDFNIEDGMFKIKAKVVRFMVNTFGGIWLNKGKAKQEIYNV